MKIKIEITLLLIISFVFISCSNQEKSFEPVDVGAMAPDFTLQTANGDDVTLSSFSNNVVLLFFFGDTCPLCKAAAPSIESRLVAPYSSRTDYTVLGLDQWDGNASSVESFMRTTGVSFPLLLKASSIAAKYNTTYDRLVVIDRQGNIAFSRNEGAASATEKVKVIVDQLLDG